MGEKNKLIKHEGDNTTFIWKHPCEDFDSSTVLIVHESQEAVFVSNGEALDLFGAGRYMLDSSNLPKLSERRDKSSTNLPFHSEVYFVNKAEQMAIKWGTDSRVQFIEPNFGFPISIGANGEMTLRVEDSRKLLVKLVGTEATLSQSTLTLFFRGVMMTKVKSYLASTIKNAQINIFEIDEHLQNLSDRLCELLKPDFADYGVTLVKFYVTTIVKPDGDEQYEKFKSLHFRQYSDIAEAKLRQQVGIINAQTEAQKTVIESEALATKRIQEGYTYQQERSFDVAEKSARATLNSVICPECGSTVLKSKFCPECGHKFVTICSRCGTEVKEGKFCPECGEKL